MLRPQEGNQFMNTRRSFLKAATLGAGAGAVPVAQPPASGSETRKPSTTCSRSSPSISWA